MGMALVGKHVASIALCMTGAAMLMNGLIDLVRRISVVMATPDDAQTIILAIEPLRVFVGYGLAAAGVLIQRQIMKPTEQDAADTQGGKPKARGVDLLKQPSEITIRPLRCLVSPFVIRRLFRPVLAFNEYLMNKIDDKEKTEDVESGRLAGAAGPAGDAVPLIDATPTSIDAGAASSDHAPMCGAARGKCESHGETESTTGAGA